MLRIDGGMATNDWMAQFLADMLGAPVERPANAEATAMGAAYLAGLSAGFWGGIAALPVNSGESAISHFTPRPLPLRESLRAGWATASARGMCAQFGRQRGPSRRPARSVFGRGALKGVFALT